MFALEYTQGEDNSVQNQFYQLLERRRRLRRTHSDDDIAALFATSEVVGKCARLDFSLAF